MNAPSTSRRPHWSTTKRSCVSILLILHLAAVFVSPWSSPPPASLLSDRVADWFRPYLSLMYLNHGYRFFAPDPGPSHLVRYEVTYADGRVEQGQIPDPQEHRPRLLYHRHFMITESLYNAWSRLEQLPEDVEIPANQRRVVEERNAYTRRLVDSLANGIGRQLLERSAGASVRLVLVEHAIPFPEDVERGRRLDDPELYAELAQFGPYTGSQP